MTQNADVGTYQIACTSTILEDAGMGKIAYLFIQKESVPVPAPGKALDHQRAQRLLEAQDPGAQTHGVPSLLRVLATPGTLKILSAPRDPGGRKALAKIRDRSHVGKTRNLRKIRKEATSAWSLQRICQKMNLVRGETSGAS